MKHNNETLKTARHKSGKRSRYATKRAGSNQMYGPGCCAHTIDPQAFYRARKRGEV